MGKTVVMGRKTFDSMGKPLPGRRNIVITRNHNFNAEGCEIVGSVIQSISLFKDEEEAFIIGGAEIFKQAIPVCTKLYLTKIHYAFEGDTYFPEIDLDKWKLISETHHLADEKNKFDYSFLVYEK